MNSMSFVGGISKRCSLGRFRDVPTTETVNEDWGWSSDSSELFLRGASATCRVFTWDGLALLIRGYARSGGGPLDLERVAEELRCHYLETGELAVDDLDGSFTLALCDSQAERVVLYRNLVGSGFTYYRPTADGLLFAGNLAELVDLGGAPPAANRSVLPGFFLFRCVPGRETLFEDVYRLLPGEEICWDRRGLKRGQRHTFASLLGETIPTGEAMERTEATLDAVLRDCRAYRPGSANLLSGGVDSSYIQAVWNLQGDRDELPPSYSISVDHPHTWADTDYAITASQALGTRHVLVPADEPYHGYLTDTVANTAEPLNHVQSAYFGKLARAMKADGFQAALCGEGADSLFGLGTANQIHNARVLRRMVPTRSLRDLAAAFTSLVGWSRLAYTFRLSSRLGEAGWPEHPVNQVATFADRAAVSRCFGPAAVEAATAERRSLLERYSVSSDPMDRLHAMGFLGEAMDSAGLWSTLFQRAGMDLLCPFLDSRMLRLALNLSDASRYPFRRPKELLKSALARRAGARVARRSKLGFGQPIFAWMAPGGQLRPTVERLGTHAFVDQATLTRVRQKPTWFLYSLMVYDTWHKLFIDRSLPRAVAAPLVRQEARVSV
jgi:asparagine synthase (glutamine-hydrolysing)